MRVFITGGTGFVGSVLVPELVRAGHRVTGLARSEASAGALAAMGAAALRGELADVDVLRRGAEEADAVIHTAFELDLSNWAKGGELDRRAIETFGRSARRIIVSSGAFGVDAKSGIALETDGPLHTLPRHTDDAAKAAGAIVVRLGVVHGPHDRHFLTKLIAIAREKGASAYIGDGAQRWPMVHVADAADAYRLALEKGPSPATYHAIAEEGVAVRDIAASIAKHLGLPLVSLAPEEAEAHFGPISMFVASTRPTSSAFTREALGWHPHRSTLLEDFADGTYFAR